MIEIKSVKSLKGTINVPGDKSISHRSIMLSSISEGISEISGFLPGQDCLSTISCFQKMGVEIDQNETNITVKGVGLHGLKEPFDILDAGNSGTTARLMLGLLSGQSFFSCLTGDNSLKRRPMDRVLLPLMQMDASIFGRNNDRFLPLAINGSKLKAIKYTLPVASAQLKSALLLAGLYAKDSVTVVEKVKSRDHSERMLNSYGAKISENNNEITIMPEPKLSSQRINIPSDISSAAFFLVAGSIIHNSEILINNVGINQTRTGCITVLKEMGANIEILNERLECGEPVADLLVKSAELKGTIIEGSIIPTLIDEIPILTVAAIFAKGKTIIRDAAELRVKESDRIAVIASELKKMNAEIIELDDGLEIHGGKPIIGAECFSHDDHRIAMSLAIAALKADGSTKIKNSECVNISYPNFFKDLYNLSKN